MNCLEGIRWIFLEYLQIRSKDCNVLIIENMFAPTMFRDQLFNVLLNEMQVQSVCFQPDLLMPIIATGILTRTEIFCKCTIVSRSSLMNAIYLHFQAASRDLWWTSVATSAGLSVSRMGVPCLLPSWPRLSGSARRRAGFGAPCRQVCRSALRKKERVAAYSTISSLLHYLKKLRLLLPDPLWRKLWMWCVSETGGSALPPPLRQSLSLGGCGTTAWWA